MVQWDLHAALAPGEAPAGEAPGALLLFTSEELSHKAAQANREERICHTPLARDARVCKAEARREFLNGTIVTPRKAKNGETIAFGYLLARELVVLCDDTGTVHSMVQHLRKENPQRDYSAGSFFYALLELLVEKDLRHLESLEDRLSQIEEQVSAGQLDSFNAKMMGLRKEISRWIKYYTQMEELVCELEESGVFSDQETQLFHRVEKRISRLKED